MKPRLKNLLHGSIILLLGLIILGCTELLDPEPTFRVNYAANGSESGTVPVDTTEYEEGTKFTVASNSGNLTKPSHTFAGWNTRADGSGAAYAENSSCTMGDVDMTFYAQWSEITKFSVTYDGNGHTGGEVPADTEGYEAESTVTVLANTGNLVKTGYKFGGWNTMPDGSGTLYTSGDTFTIPDGDITLYARWISDSTPTFTLTYDGNGHDAGQAPVDLTSYESEATVTVLDNSGGLSKGGYDFAGWNTSPDGYGTTYSPGSPLTIGSSDVILYALWEIPSASNTFFNPDPFQTFNAGYDLTIEMAFYLNDPNNSTVWFVLGDAGATAPSVTQIKAGNLGDGSTAIAAAEVAGTENVAYLTNEPAGLEPSTNYKVFAYGESTSGESSGIIAASVTTQNAPADYFNTGPSVTPNADGTATISFSSYKYPTPDLLYALYSKDSAPTVYGPVIQAILNSETPSGALQAGVFLSGTFYPAVTYLDAIVSNIDDGQYSMLIIARDAALSNSQLVANYQSVVKDFTITRDVTPPVFAAGYPKIILGFDNFGDSQGHFTFYSKLNEPGDVLYVVLEDGAAAPTPQEVANGTGSGGTTAVLNPYSPIYYADTEYMVNKYSNGGLTAGTEYDLYAVTRDEAAGNISADPVKIDFVASTITAQGWVDEGITPYSVTTGTEHLISIVTELFTVTSADANLDISVDVSELGGAVDAIMYDDGTNGDVTPDDGAYSLDYLVPSSTVPGNYSLKATLSGTDKYGNEIESKIRTIGDLTVTYPGYSITEELGSSLTPITGDAAATNQDGLSGDYVTLTLPFDVNFYGDVYNSGTSVDVSEYGGLTFGGDVSKFLLRAPTTGSTYAKDETYAGNSAAPGIAVHHSNNIDTEESMINRGIWVKTEGSSPNREFIIEWNYTDMLGYTYNFQIRFYENAGDTNPDFRIAYLTMSSYSTDYSMTAFKSELQTSDHIVPPHYRSAKDITPGRWSFTW
ncbi:MAG: hypothetical protein GF372_13395 [Candidatus Marinimicrobia bacterium]|nr:hypothetical protein [Candidatus Neomarinimicrobiota bacterium]